MSIEPITKQPDGAYPPGKRFQQWELFFKIELFLNFSSYHQPKQFWF